MKYVLLFFLFLSCDSAFAQLQLFADTIGYSFRTGGAIDSVDRANAWYASVFDGGVAINGAAGFSAEHLRNHHLYQVNKASDSYPEMKFSALPHLGFAYSFGTQNAQHIRAVYHQAFSPKMLLNVHFDKNSGAGFLRNSSFSNNNVALQLRRVAKRYSFELQGDYAKIQISHPGGITTDTLIVDYGLEYSPVFKEDAKSTVKRGRAALHNYFNVLNDSSMQLGLITVHRFEIENRIYEESGPLALHYDNIFIDSFSTRDQFNFPSISNGAGAYFQGRKQTYVDFVVKHRYWQFQNLGLMNDTVEIDLTSAFRWTRGGFKLSNDLSANLEGAYQGISDKMVFSYLKRRLDLRGILSYNNVAPLPFQRFYFSNNTAYKISNVTNNKFYFAEADFVWELISGRLRAGITGTANYLDQLYVFDSVTWRNDVLQDYFYATGGLNFTFTYKSFFLTTDLIFASDDRDYLPDFQSYMRIYFKKKVFKAKKLELVVGVEPSYCTSYRMRSYNPTMDLMIWTGDNDQVPSMANLHAFFNLGIDEFRFYLRYENIGYFWNDQRTEVLENYPLTGNRFRVGITWDFFN